MIKFESIKTLDANGVHHCDDGPAIIWSNGYRRWYLNGRLHRTDGPASLYADGTKGWWLDNTRYGVSEKPPEEYLDKLKEMGIKFVRGSDEV
jgi:hypothetical protein